jgi:coproporphyrinogen III oxidase
MLDHSHDIVDSWFGGGLDLTPYILYEEDAIHFHQICKTICDRHEVADYNDYKQKCDEYFYNHHRKEARGIGGLFYDYCRSSSSYSMEDWLAFQKDIAKHFLEAYVPIVERRKQEETSESQREWQEIRRGRYVEFNLLHDKGTLFGLKTNGRIESILMSLPPIVQWRYNHQPETGSRQEELVKVLKNPREWV